MYHSLRELKFATVTFIECIVVIRPGWICNHLKWTKGLLDSRSDIRRDWLWKTYEKECFFFSHLPGKHSFQDFNEPNACRFPRIAEHFSSPTRLNICISLLSISAIWCINHTFHVFCKWFHAIISLEMSNHFIQSSAQHSHRIWTSLNWYLHVCHVWSIISI